MQNKSIRAIFAFLFMLTFGCEKNTLEITGSGIAIIEDRTLRDFDAIQISGLIQSTISYGTVASLSIRADDNIVPRIHTIVNNGTLTISLEEGTYANKLDIRIEIINPNLRALIVTDGGSSLLQGFAKLEALDIMLSGIGNITAKGQVKMLCLSNHIGGQFHGFDLLADTCLLDQSGISTTELTISRLLHGQKASGNLYYKGQPIIEVDCSGIGRIINAN